MSAFIFLSNPAVRSAGAGRGLPQDGSGAGSNSGWGGAGGTSAQPPRPPPQRALGTGWRLLGTVGSPGCAGEVSPVLAEFTPGRVGIGFFPCYPAVGQRWRGTNISEAAA